MFEDLRSYVVFLIHPPIDGKINKEPILKMIARAHKEGIPYKIVDCSECPTIGAIQRSMYDCVHLIMWGDRVSTPLLNAISANMKLQKKCQHLYMFGEVAKPPIEIDQTYIDILANDMGENVIDVLVRKKKEVRHVTKEKEKQGF